MRVILLKKSENLGEGGDIVDVKSGYARNYLFPQRLAIEVTKGNLNQVEGLKRKRTVREAKEFEEIKKLQSRMEGLILEFTKKAGEKGKLFGSVTTKEIADQLSEVVGFEFDRKFIELDEPIKEVGEREIRLNFGKGFHTMVKMKISSEETREEKES